MLIWLTSLLPKIKLISGRIFRWYLRVFAEILDMAVDNAFIMMKREYYAVHSENLSMSVKEFRQRLASAIVPYEEKLRKTCSSATGRKCFKSYHST